MNSSTSDSIKGFNSMMFEFGRIYPVNEESVFPAKIIFVPLTIRIGRICVSNSISIESKLLISSTNRINFADLDTPEK